MQQLQGRPRVVAHRGASQVLAEHTLAAYRKALEDGAEGLECDVRLTADAHLVCVHDRRIDRVTGTRGLVSTMRLSDLDGLDFAAWKNPWAVLDDESEDLDPESTKVLTLRRLFEMVRDYDRRIELAIETKHPTRYAGLVERKVVELLWEFGWTGKNSPARIMSFSPVALTRVERLAPELEVVLLIDSAYAWRVSSGVLRPNWIAGPGIELLQENPKVAKALRKQGRRLHVWTVNRPADIDLCLKYGVEAVITDCPAETMKYLRKVRPT